MIKADCVCCGYSFRVEEGRWVFNEKCVMIYYGDKGHLFDIVLCENLQHALFFTMPIKYVSSLVLYKCACIYFL